MVELSDHTGQINKLNPQTDTDMETNNTTPSTLKGQAKRTYNRVMAAIAEDNAASMCHTFSTLTQQAKTIVLQCGKFSNLYVRGELKELPIEEAAKDLTARCVACVRCKVRKIDIVISTVFITEYISRQRKEIEAPKPTTPETDTINADNTTEFSELSHAGQCLDIYLNNTREIHDRYTVPAIKLLVNAARHRNGAKYTSSEYWNVLQRTSKDMHAVKNAVQAAVRLVRKYDGMQPTAQDVEAVTANYVAYLVDAAMN